MKLQSKNEFIGNKIKSYRKKRKWTQQDLADRIGVKGNTISSYEAGKIEIPHSKLLVMARVFDIKTIDLLPVEESEKNDTISEYIKEAKSELNDEQMVFLEKLLEKTLSLNESERAEFLKSVEFAVKLLDNK